MSWLVPSVGGDDQGAVGDDSRATTGLDQSRRVRLLDNGRTANLKADRHRRPIVDVGRDKSAAFGGENGAFALGRVIALRARRCRRRRSADGAAVDAAEIDDAGRALGAVAVDAVMRREEVPVERLERVGGTGLKRNLEMVGLPDVADIGEVEDLR